MHAIQQVDRCYLRVSSQSLGRTRGLDVLSRSGGSAQIVLDEVRRYEDKKEGIINLPTPGSGEDVFTVQIPAGLQFAHADLIVEQASALAKAKIDDRPDRGATGRKEILVAWSHPPWGNVRYRLQVHASPDGASPTVSIPVEEASAEERARLLIEQDVPFDAVLSGPIAQTFKGLLDKNAKEQGQPLAKQQVTGVDDAVVIGAVVTISLALIALTAIALGLIAFAALCYFAMEKGYNLEDTGYEVQTGEGESKQVHKLRFKVRKPGT